MRLLFGTFAISLTLSISGQASADSIAQCGASRGHAYFPLVGLNATDSNGSLSENGIAGFSADASSDGIIVLTQSPSGNVDLLFGSDPSKLISATGDGAKVFAINQSGSSMTVVVAYPRLIETYTFLVSTSGPEVMWTTNKFATPVIKAGVYRAYCSEMNLPKY